eukprot:5573084-Amphidinium_carterae.1
MELQRESCSCCNLATQADDYSACSVERHTTCVIGTRACGLKQTPKHAALHAKFHQTAALATNLTLTNVALLPTS